jgi:signal transduction histidine kinase
MAPSNGCWHCRSLRLAEEQDPDGLDRVRATVSGAKDDVGAALSEVLELAHGIHPQSLSDGGLAAALETLPGAARCVSS